MMIRKGKRGEIETIKVTVMKGIREREKRHKKEKKLRVDICLIVSTNSNLSYFHSVYFVSYDLSSLVVVENNELQEVPHTHLQVPCD